MYLSNIWLIGNINLGNYIRVDTGFIFTTIRQFKDKFCFCQKNAKTCNGGPKQNYPTPSYTILYHPTLPYTILYHPILP